MKILLHKNFDKNYKKLKESEKRSLKDRRNIFLKNQFDPILNNHALSGKYQGCRSINITGDIRAIYRVLHNEELAYFITIDTHSNLYK